MRVPSAEMWCRHKNDAVNSGVCLYVETHCHSCSRPQTPSQFHATHRDQFGDTTQLTADRQININNQNINNADTVPHTFRTKCSTGTANAVPHTLAQNAPLELPRQCHTPWHKVLHWNCQGSATHLGTKCSTGTANAQHCQITKKQDISTHISYMKNKPLRYLNKSF